MKRLFVLAAFISGFALIGATQTQAASTANITVTVSLGEIISVNLDAGTWNIGSIALSSVTESSAYTATNNGNVTENFAIKGADGANGWTIGGTPALNTFKVAADASPYSAYNITLSASDTSLASSIATSGTQAFKLQYSAPTADDKGAGKDQGFTITLTASKTP